jgi:hypothetical protein
VRFSFETESLRQAVEVAAELRRVNPTGVRVRPAQFAPMGSLRWAILVTTPPLEASEIAALEEDMRRVSWRAPGLRFTGWLYLSAPVERTPTPPAAAPARARVLAWWGRQTPRPPRSY